MKFKPLNLPGAFFIEPEPIGDDRGFFARIFCKEEFANHGISFECQQMNHSYSKEKGTLRGLHYQLHPKEEIKLVKCVKGKIFDVILDLRIDSPTFGKYEAVELTEENRHMALVPEGCAHGFYTLTDDSEVVYSVSNSYSKSLERGVRWNDPKFAIEWPGEPNVISERDQKHPDFDHFYHLNIATVS